MRPCTISFSSLIVFTVLSLNTALKANAQKRFHLGLSLSGNAAAVKYTPEPYHNGTFTAQYRLGVAAGLTSQWLVGQQVAIQPGLRYVRSGFATVETSASSTGNGNSASSHYENRYKLNRLEVPVNVLYFINQTTEGPYALVGASAGVLLGGKRSSESTFTTNGATTTFTGSDDIVVGSTYPLGATQYYLRRWVVGVQAGIGYQQGRLGVQAAYRWGLLNTATASALNLPSPTSYSRLVEVQANYYILK
jgi:hypothetical protein